MTQLSKSDYMMFLKHPAWLWLKKHEPDKLPAVDAATQAIFDAGHKFEPYAEQLFPDGVQLGFDGFGEYKTLTSRTQTALDDGAKTIFQGRFEFGQLTFICDIFNLVGEGEVDLYEIKSSTGVKPEHEVDLAFQTTVLMGCGYKVRNVYVIHVNNKFVRKGKVDPKKLTVVVDVTDAVKAKLELTKENIKRALETINLPRMPDSAPSLAHPSAYRNWLEVYKGLASIGSGSIYDLGGASASKITELEKMGVTDIIDIPDDFYFTAKLQIHVQSAKRDEIILDKKPIKEFLNTFTYPLYFLDYETMSSTVPYFDGLRPYRQLPFQYSIHILDSPDAQLRQVEYLHRENTNPAEEISISLKSHIGDTGTVVTWNMSFEKGCNTMLGELVPEYAEFFEQLNSRVVDLMTPFSKNWFVHKDFKGSASLKSVLPALVPELSYRSLGIQEGATAQRIWMETILDGEHEEEKEKILNDLIEYCKLDTLAMVELFRVLSKI